MAHKTLIGGTAYEIKGGKTLIDGTGHEIKSGKTLVGGTAYNVSFGVSYDPVFANNDWATIIAVCQSGVCPDEWAVGDQKAMTINGKSYAIDIIGKNHDTYTAGGIAPLSFQLHEVYASYHNMNSSDTNSGGYDNTAMHKSTLPSIKATMPSEVQAAIKPVDKKSSTGTKSSAIETISCSLFLLSEIEIFGAVSNSFAGEGSQYEYYKAGNSKVKYNSSGAAQQWWERSPSKYQNTYFCLAYSNGTASQAEASRNRYVSFAFCF